MAAEENEVPEDLWTDTRNETLNELENCVIALKTDALEARERRLDDAALAKGFVVSKARSVKQDGRYIIVSQPVKMIRTSRNAAFPYSFSLEEAEAYLARQP